MLDAQSFKQATDLKEEVLSPPLASEMSQGKEPLLFPIRVCTICTGYPCAKPESLLI